MSAAVLHHTLVPAHASAFALLLRTVMSASAPARRAMHCVLVILLASLLSGLPHRALAQQPAQAAASAVAETSANTVTQTSTAALQTTAVQGPSKDSSAATVGSYRVGVGDELNFRFLYTPELNTAAVVRGDGAVSLPLLGEFTVQGYTLAELTAQVQAALATRVRRPQVVINVQGNIPSQRIFVGGEVARPGVQNLAGPLTALQAVMAAEGLKDTAQPANVTVLRQGAGGQRVVLQLDLAAVMAGRDGAQDIVLAPYDVVLVPRSGVANAGLWVDQWVRRILPINLGFSYAINRNGSLQ